MVHTWVSSQAAAVPASNKSVSIASRSPRMANTRQSNSSNWKLARSLFFLFAFLLLFSGFTLVHTFASSDIVAPASSQELVVSADSGDTLWQLARTYKSDSVDTRQAVYEITKRNALKESDLHIGQSLIIPERILP